MDYLDFQKVLRKEVSKSLGEEYNLDIKKVDKNNGVKEIGLSIGKQDSNISPIIYLEKFYMRYLNEEKFASLVEDVIQLYHSTSKRRESFEKLDLEFDTWKDRIVYRLVSLKKNEKRLEKAPHILYLDLAIVFSVIYNNGDSLMESIRIDNTIMKTWNVSTKTLYKIAKENTPRIFPPKTEHLSSIFMELEGIGKNEDKGNYTGLENDPFLVVTNSSGVHGATVLLYKNVLKDIAVNLKSDLYILPSSIHEVLILPMKKEYDKDRLTEMVREINESQLAEEDILSDHAYIYRIKEGKVEV